MPIPISNAIADRKNERAPELETFKVVLNARWPFSKFHPPKGQRK
jgi:hypothetical protein